MRSLGSARLDTELLAESLTWLAKFGSCDHAFKPLKYNLQIPRLRVAICLCTECSPTHLGLFYYARDIFVDMQVLCLQLCISFLSVHISIPQLKCQRFMRWLFWSKFNVGLYSSTYRYWYRYYVGRYCSTLAHWGRDKMAGIFQTAFSNGFSWMKMHELRLNFIEVCP